MGPTIGHLVVHPQVVEPTLLDPPYAPVSDSKITRNDDTIMHLNSNGEVIPTTHSDSTFVEEMERA